MRAAVYYSNNDVRLEDRPVPRIGPGEVLMKVEASGVCGSDVMEWYRAHKVPLILGHEVAGTVAETCGDVGGLSVGDRIVVSHHVPCLDCDFCRGGHETMCETLGTTNFDPGGFCEFLRVPAVNVRVGVYPIPDGLSDEEACFAEPLACVLRGQKIAGMEAGKRVLVIGAGISGLLHINLAAAMGAETIIATDLHPYRIEAAKRFGAKTALGAKDLTPDSLRLVNGGRLADLVISTAGAPPAILQAFQCVERGGTVLIFAPTMPGETVPLSINQVFWKRDVTLTTSYAGSPADHLAALRLIADGRVRPKDMITHRFGLADTQKAFQLVAAGGESIKVIIHPHQ